MYVLVQVPVADAVRRGSTRSGNIRLPVTDEQLAGLSQEQREALIACRALDAEEGRALGLVVPEPTWPEVVRVLDVLVGEARAKAEAEAAKRATIEAECRQIFAERRTVSRWESYSLCCSSRAGDPCVEARWEVVRPAWYPHKPTDPEMQAWEASLASETEARMASAIEVARAESHRLGEEVRAEAAAKAEAEKRYRAARDELVREQGTESQRRRLADGLLPEREADELVYATAFAALNRRRRYHRISAHEIHGGEACEEGNGESHCEFHAEEAESLGEAEYDELREILELLKPLGEAATVQPRFHEGYCRDCNRTVQRYSARVAIQWHGRELVREYQLGGEDAPPEGV